MATSMDELLRILESDEPDYDAAAAIGPDALGYLAELARHADPLLASKATYLASLIPSAGARAVLEEAARREEPEVRVAAASALRNLGTSGESLADADPAVDLLDRLLHDSDAGVRKFAVRSAATLHASGVRASVAAAADADPAPFVRAAAREALPEL